MSCITGKKSLKNLPQSGWWKALKMAKTIWPTLNLLYVIYQPLNNIKSWCWCLNLYFQNQRTHFRHCHIFAILQYGMSQNSIPRGSGFESHLGRLSQTMLVDSFSIVAVVQCKDNILKNISYEVLSRFNLENSESIDKWISADMKMN